MKGCSLARLGRVLLEVTKSIFGSRVELWLRNISKARVLSWLPASVASDLKVSLCHGCVSCLCDKNFLTGDREVSEDTGRIAASWSDKCTELLLW